MPGEALADVDAMILIDTASRFLRRCENGIATIASVTYLKAGTRILGRWHGKLDVFIKIYRNRL